MAKGKKSLLETTDLPIIATDKEEGQIPYFIIDDKYGVSCDERCEMLCRKKKASRTIKDEEGNPHHVETYYMWESFCYTNSFSSCVENYINIKDRELKKERLIKTKDYNKMIEIQQEIKRIIDNSFSSNGNNKEFLSITHTIDQQAKLNEELIVLKNLKNQVQDETDKLMQLIKEKRAIIISNTEPKKHRVKKENGDV
jgi:hypothetical protein